MPYTVADATETRSQIAPLHRSADVKSWKKPVLQPIGKATTMKTITFCTVLLSLLLVPPVLAEES